MRKLFFTTGSPFARAVRIVLVEKGLDFERAETYSTPSAEDRAKVTPTLLPWSMASWPYGIPP
jgi:glutathione S-transferase